MGSSPENPPSPEQDAYGNPVKQVTWAEKARVRPIEFQGNAMKTFLESQKKAEEARMAEERSRGPDKTVRTPEQMPTNLPNIIAADLGAMFGDIDAIAASRPMHEFGASGRSTCRACRGTRVRIFSLSLHAKTLALVGQY